MKKLKWLVMLCGLVGIAHADQPASQKVEESFHHTHAGDWFTRLRALHVHPDDSSGSINTIPNTGVHVRPAWTGEFDFGYMITRNLGLELILATSHHTLMGKKALSGTKIGTTWVLPPTLTAQWRFFPSSIVQPYLGAGVNYTLFYNNHCSLSGTRIDLKHSWGPAVQVGADFFIYKDWLFNFDFKYIWSDTTAHLKGAIKGKVDVDVDPWVIGFGFGRKW